MSGEIRVPRLGWSMDEGTFVEWLKPEGATVAPGEPLFVLEGDKSAQDVEAIDGGVVRRLPDGPAPGDVVRVGQVIGLIESPGDAAAAPGASAVAPAAAAPPPAAPAAGPPPVVPPTLAPAAAPAVPPPTAPASSPRARRAARELGVDLTNLEGTGRGGRVRERDVLAAGRSAAAQGPTVDTVVALSPTRRTIGERMIQSRQATAPVTLTARAVATNLVQLRKQFQATASGGDDPVPTYTDLVIALVARVLARHPWLNSRREGDRVVLCAAVNMGVAVDTEGGLVAPVIRDAGTLGVRELAARSRTLIARARARALTPDDQRGGSFTVTNLGMYGIDAFTPILNPPETAILGLGALRREPVCVGDDRFAAADHMTLSLTFDHQVVDGGPAARFLQDVCRGLENIAAVLVG